MNLCHGCSLNWARGKAMHWEGRLYSWFMVAIQNIPHLKDNRGIGDTRLVSKVVNPHVNFQRISIFYVVILLHMNHHTAKVTIYASFTLENSILSIYLHYSKNL